MRFSPQKLILGSTLAVALVVLQARQVRSSLAQAHPPQLAPGAVAPAFEFVGSDGTPLPLSEIRGHPLVVSFWAAWCAPCRKELPEVAGIIDAWNAKAAAADRVVFVTVNEGDEPSSVSMFVEDQRLRSARFTYDREGSVAELWRVRAFPTIFFVDRKGGIRDVHEGYDMGFAYSLESLFQNESRMAARP